jgi:hypothetical protein
MQNPADFDRSNNGRFENMPNEVPGRVYYNDYTGVEYYPPYSQGQINYPPYTPPKKNNSWLAPVIGVLGALAVFLIIFLIIKLQDKKNTQVDYDNQTGLFSNTFSQETESISVPDSFTQSNDDLLATLRAREVELTQESLEQTLTVLSLPSETPPPTATSNRCNYSAFNVGDSAWVRSGIGIIELMNSPSINASSKRSLSAGAVLLIVGRSECVDGDIMWQVKTTHMETGWVFESRFGQSQLQRIETINYCPGRLPGRLTINGYGFVQEEPKLRNIMRVEPNSSSVETNRIHPGQTFLVLAGPECASGQIWWKIRDLSNNIEGWTRESGIDNNGIDDYFIAPIMP